MTAIFGMGPIGVYYFTNVFDSSLYLWYDYVLAVGWIVAVFLFCFRSKIYWGLAEKKDMRLPTKPHMA